jgi:hypothetical protein
MSDVSESYKGSIHLGLFALAAVCGAYNLGALLSRKEWRLGMNVAVYSALAAFEAMQVKGHFSECRD